MIWRGRRVDVADLALGKQLEVSDVRVDHGSSSGHRDKPGEEASKQVALQEKVTAPLALIRCPFVTT